MPSSLLSNPNPLLSNRSGLALKVAIPQVILVLAYLASQNFHLLKSSFFNEGINAGLGWAFMSISLLFYTLLTHLEDGYKLAMKEFANGFANHSEESVVAAEKSLRSEGKTLGVATLSGMVVFTVFLGASGYQAIQGGPFVFINHAVAFVAIFLALITYVIYLSGMTYESFGNFISHARRNLEFSHRQFRILVDSVADNRMKNSDVLLSASKYVEIYATHSSTQNDFDEFKRNASAAQLQALRTLNENL